MNLVVEIKQVGSSLRSDDKVWVIKLPNGESRIVINKETTDVRREVVSQPVHQSTTSRITFCYKKGFFI